MAVFNTLLVFTVYSMNFILLVGALFLIYVCLSDERQRELSDSLAIDIEFYALFPKILLAVSIIVAIISFIGCFGIAIDNDYMLIVYVIILSILMLLKIFLVIFLSQALSSSRDANAGGDDLQNKILDLIKGNSHSAAFHSYQRGHNCCGIEKPEDWTAIRKEIPGSCCKKGNSETCTLQQVFSKQGCKKKILEQVGTVIRTLMNLVIHVFVIEIILVVFCILILMDVGQSDEDDTSEENVLAGQIKNVSTSKEDDDDDDDDDDDVKFEESIDTHDLLPKRAEDVESPVLMDEEIVGVHDDERPFEETVIDEIHDDGQDEGIVAADKHEEESHEEEKDEEETHEEERHEEESHEEETHEEEKHEENQDEETHDEEIHEEEPHQEEKPVKEKRKRKKQNNKQKRAQS